MNWTVKLSKRSVQQIKKLPLDRQNFIRQKLRQLEANPKQGDIRSIRAGKYKGSLRLRAGRFRIIFKLDEAMRLIDVTGVMLRNERTYR